MIIGGNIIYADEGKILRRIADKLEIGTEYYLGYTYYINGQKLEEPKLEVPEDFEEIFIWQTEEEIRKNREYEERFQQYPTLVEKYIREKYSISDELAIQRQRDTKPEDFAEYNTFCEECKAKAKKELNL